MTKSKFIETIRQRIADGETEEALELFRQHISEYDDSLLTDATLLQSRFQTAYSGFVIKNILPREDFDRTVAQVNYAILELLEKIEKDAVISQGGPKDKTSGRILHNIPGTMPLSKETRCIIRLAYDDASLTRDFKITNDTVVQNIRIAEVMSVDLLDFNEVPAFQIRTLNGAEQFLASDDYTQWLFMVKPILEGKYSLTLKVAVIEQIDGKERKRDIVLEKEIFIINQPNVQGEIASARSPMPSASESGGFEETNLKLNMANEENNTASTIPSSSPVGKKAALSGIFAVLASIVVAMTGFYVYNGYNGGVFSSKPNGNVVIADPSGTDNNNNTPKNNPSPLDTSHFKVNNNIANTDTSKEKTFEIEEPRIYSQVQQKVEVIVDVPVKIKQETPKTPIRTRTKPTKSKGISTNSSDVAGNTPKTNRMPSSVPDTIKKEESPAAYQVPTRIEKSYKVRIKLQGEMKEAEILVNGEKPLAVKKNVWGTPQYVEFKSFSEKQTFTFIHNGISCKVENIVILNDEVTVEACSFKK
jgi:Effector-associated domain 11